MGCPLFAAYLRLSLHNLKGSGGAVNCLAACDNGLDENKGCSCIDIIEVVNLVVPAFL